MTSTEILESGLLQQYAMGLATNDEVLIVEKALAADSSLLEEFFAIAKSLETLGATFAQKSPEEAKAQLFEKIFSSRSKQLNQPETEAKTVSIGGGTTTSAQETKVVSITPWYTYVAAASAFIGVLFSVFLLNKQQSLNSELEAVKTELAQRDQVLAVTYQKLESTQSNLEIFTTSEVKTLKMQGEKFSEVPVAYAKDKEQVLIATKALPKREDGKVYQFWAIVDGKPVDMGLLTLAEDGEPTLVNLKGIKNIQAFAVSLEEGGPKASPTDVILVGAV